MQASLGELRERAAAYGQGHLFQYWDGLDAARQAALLADVERIDFALVRRLVQAGLDGPPAAIDPAKIEPADVYPAKPDAECRGLYAEATAAGEAALRAGKVAAMVVAGGQGTRLGFDAPKGTFPISPVKHKTLFELFAETIRAVARRYGCRLPWYVMTSSATDAATRAYFEGNDYLGLPPEDVLFFEQGVMPAVDRQGRILLAEKHRVALSPNGHGGSLAALRDCGVLADMRRRGAEIISYFQVDNPLASPADPLFIGLHRLTEAQVSSLAVAKADDLERVGNFVKVDGRLQVIEYSDLPDALAHARNADGSRRLDAGSIAIHLLERRFVEALTGGGGGDGGSGGTLELPWHLAHKRVPYIDTKTGALVEPEAPNAVKFEMFIFDAIPLAEKAIVLARPRGECFSPVKNATGVDSAATARRDMVLRALAWLAQAGAKVPAPGDSQPAATVEISPLFALDAGQLATKLTLPFEVKPGQTVYLE